MSERVAIVVGAAVSSAAQKLAAAGYTVAGVDRSEEGLKELPDGIRREAADPTDPAAARSVVDRIAAGAGPPEVLVNTIGTSHLGDALAATPEDLRLMIDVNVGSALWLTQAVVHGQTIRLKRCEAMTTAQDSARGRTAVVTASAGAIGTAIAKALQEVGHCTARCTAARRSPRSISQGVA